MKNLIKASLFLLVTCILFACEKEEKDINIPIEKGRFIDTLIHDGIDRRYMVYVPQSYNGEEPVPLLLYFHCARNKSEWPDPIEFVQFAWEYEEIAERETFILVAPQSTIKMDGGNEFWVWNEDRNQAPTSDDIGFVSSLIDKLADKYKIDTERVYAAGYSWGAYFSFSLACELSDRIAAIAGLSGYMRPSYLDLCEPERPVPVLQIHGERDVVSDYNENLAENNPGVQATLDFWIEHNQTLATPVIDSLNVSFSDQYWQEIFSYNDGNNESVVQHIKVRLADHDWHIYNGTKEVNAPEEFWKFVSRYDINGLIE